MEIEELVDDFIIFYVAGTLSFISNYCHLYVCLYNRSGDNCIHYDVCHYSYCSTP